MNRRLRVLIVEDSENDTLLILRVLKRGGFETEFKRVETAADMRSALEAEPWDTIISDFSMPQFSGLDALSVLKETGRDIPFILVSGTIGEDSAVAAMKAGAHDYVMKTNLERLCTAIERELREAKIRTESRQASERLRYLAQYDPLTDLPNRNLLQERLEQSLFDNMAVPRPVALMLMDLDEFREINNTMGHPIGDLVLKEVGSRLTTVLRERDTLARLGGDEFAVLLTDGDQASATIVARKLLNALDAPFQAGGVAVDVRASMGIALCPRDGADPATLMRRADIAMYSAKSARSGFAFYSPENDLHSPERLSLIADLHRAIVNDELFLVYQPKVDLRTNAVVGLEALSRWRRREFGLVPPDQFIALAERTGFIKPLTFWALDAALGQCRSWLDQGMKVPVSVNMSARGIHDPTLPNRLLGFIDRHGLVPDLLELEITESAMMVDPDRALEILTRISEMGVSLSIDDFGTGYSSLSYLKKLPVHSIKIDKTFVINMITDPNDEFIVRSTIELAHNLGLAVIAEGVESREHLDRLTRLGCDRAQGYYMTRPLSGKEMTDWLRALHWKLDGAVPRTVGQWSDS